MALTDKKYSSLHGKTGSDKDGIKAKFDEGHQSVYVDNPDAGDPTIVAMIYQIGQLEEELDYLRTEISANKDKAGISSSQASAITANTAKTGITSGEQRDIAGNKTNVASNVTEITKLIRGKLSMSAMPIVQAGVEQAVECGVVYDLKTKTYSMSFAYSETTPAPKGGKATTVTRTGSIQLR
jgi:hypothetical protein